MVINIDQNELKLDYEQGKTKYSRAQEIDMIKLRILDEVQKFRK